MAWYDFLYSGDAGSLHGHFALLKVKTLTALAGPDGLISTRTGLVTDQFKRELGLDESFIDFESRLNLRDLVDWPHAGFQGSEATPGETDGYVFTDFNTAVNALHHRALILMQRISRVVGSAATRRFSPTAPGWWRMPSTASSSIPRAESMWTSRDRSCLAPR